MFGKSEELEYVFNPDSVAIVGASEKDGHTRALVNSRIKDSLFLINPEKKEIYGYKCYDSILDIEEEIDYALIRVPALEVPKVLEECIEKGIKVAHIYSSGFSETGRNDRIELEEKIKELAKGEIRLIGPNCMGVFSAESGLTFKEYSPEEEGPIAIVTQSGTFANYSLMDSEERDIRFSKVVSYGNAIDLDCTDFLEYLKDDSDTELIILYIEGTQEGERLRRILEETTRKKPVLAMKGGLSKHGRRAVSSHTGAMAGKSKIWSSIFQQVGVVQVKTYEELMDTAQALIRSPIPEGKGTSIVTPSGGLSVNMTDLAVDIGLEVPEFGEETKDKLRELIPLAGTSIKNPLDAWPSYFSGNMPDALEVVASDESIDSLILDFRLSIPYIKGQFGEDYKEFFEEFVREVADACGYVKEDIRKPLVVSSPVSLYWDDEEREQQKKARAILREEDIPIYPSIERAAKVLYNMYRYYKLSQEREHSSTQQT